VGRESQLAIDKLLLGRRTNRILVASLFATLALWLIVLAMGSRPVARASMLLAPGDPLPRVQCISGYAATIYAEGLSSPDGLAFSPDGDLYVVEETAGEVSRVDANGDVTSVLDNLDSPEGIAFDDSGNMYVVEDVEAGRLIKREPNGVTSTLATNLDAPEGVVWTSSDTLYVTESNIQFETNPAALRSRVTAVSQLGEVTPIITNVSSLSGTNVIYWSYAGITSGPDGLLYVTNELSNAPITVTVGPFTFTLATTDSLFTVDPLSETRSLFASDLTAPEGVRFSVGGNFPLYVAEEDTGGGAGRLSRVQADGNHEPFCTGFLNVEDVVLDGLGSLYVSEDTSGMIIHIKRPHSIMLPLVLRDV